MKCSDTGLDAGQGGGEDKGVAVPARAASPSDLSPFGSSQSGIANAWQPIETAPAQTLLLVFIPRSDHPENLPDGRHVIAYKRDWGPHLKAEWRYGSGEHSSRQCGWPSHWMPLPPPPSVSGSAI